MRTSKPADRADWKFDIWIADFLLCWFALVGLVNATFDLAAFAFASNRTVFAQSATMSVLIQPATTSDDRLVECASHIATSAVGFTYMLWRFNWRCRLTTMLQIMLLSCVSLGIAPSLQSHPTILPLVVYGALALYVFGSTVSWASRPKGRALPQVDARE